MKSFRIADRVIHADLNEILVGGRTIHLEPKMMAVLCELAAGNQEVISRERLLQRVWAGVFVSDDVLTNAISVLRKALGEKAGSAVLIQTIPRRGYRLTVPVEAEFEHSNPVI